MILLMTNLTIILMIRMTKSIEVMGADCQVDEKKVITSSAVSIRTVLVSIGKALLVLVEGEDTDKGVDIPLDSVVDRPHHLNHKSKISQLVLHLGKLQGEQVKTMN